MVFSDSTGSLPLLAVLSLIELAPCSWKTEDLLGLLLNSLNTLEKAELAEVSSLLAFSDSTEGSKIQSLDLK